MNGGQPPSANYPIASLYCGDLSPDVTEAMLFEKFSTAGPVLSIRVCRDLATRRSLGYAYVNFQQPSDAERAIDTMNYEPIKGRPMRIMWSQRDPTLRRTGVGNIFIKNLHKNIDNKALYDTFSAFGNILSCKVACDEASNSLGYGFVHFETKAAADEVIKKVNGMMLNDKKVYVGPFMSRREREDKNGDTSKKYRNVFVKNFDDLYDDDSFKEAFSECGEITSCVIMKNEDGTSKGFGFVAFEEHEAAEKAVTEYNNKEIGGRKLVVCRAQKKQERAMELRSKFEAQKMERISRYQGVNLYIKNLEDGVDDERLRKEFIGFGNITSAKVMTDEKGVSKGFGFVCFSSPDEATKAVTEMNGRILVTKPLYVALAQRKDERRAQLSSQFMQRVSGYRLQPGAAMQSQFVQQPYYIPAAAPMQQPPRGSFVTGPPLTRPKWHQGGYPRQVTAMQYQGGQGQVGSASPGNRVRGQGTMQARAMPQHQMAGQTPAPRQGSQVMRASGPQAPGQRANTAYQPKTVGPVRSANNQIPADQHAQPINSSLLANSNLHDQKQLLGERMFPLVQAFQPLLAGKITGMLLEIDNSELLHLLDNQHLLREKINEAVQVLNAHQAKEATQKALQVEETQQIS